ncbi:hypothetical protein [Serratia fonticola]|uniref:hypothetical protein n=1 Tax=Serratia fonticola TaxID=47917 RepID=UPI001AE55FB7|nr:hypothetical protein [Serratia fonticola]MBP1002373.1 hypothetical protein [Serratia fonticola]
MAITATEAKIKLAEIAADIVKQHIQSAPGLYGTKGDMVGAFEKVYEAVYKKVAAKDQQKSNQ